MPLLISCLQYITPILMEYTYSKKKKRLKNTIIAINIYLSTKTQNNILLNVNNCKFKCKPEKFIIRNYNK